MTIILGYWNIRGLATPIRLLLEHAGADWRDQLYEAGPPPDFNREEWLKVKFELGLDFPNLPYIIDGHVKLSHSNVILRYLARKFNLLPESQCDQVRAELLHAQLYDFHIEYARVVYNADNYDQLKAAYVKTIDDKLRLLSKWLGDKQFAVGDKLSYVDFVFFEYLEFQVNFDPNVLKAWPKLNEYLERMRNLESVKRYFASEKAIKEPWNGAPAVYGGKYSHLLTKEQKSK